MKPKERTITDIFFVSISLKTIQGIIELAAGILILLSTTGYISRILIKLSEIDMLEGPKDSASVSLIHTATNFSSASKTFIVIYLLAHGIIKIFLIIGLFRKKLWAYTAFMYIMIAFTAYEIYRLAVHYSLLLAIISAFDILLIYLVMREAAIVEEHTT